MDTKYFKEKLLKLQIELTDQQTNNAEAADVVTLDQAAVGRLSRMDALQGQAMAQETKRRNEVELIRINSALERIKSSDYGYCLHCDEEISEKRLEINPSATLCIKCASENEKN
ncbi:MAG: TraR/DksA family transcriptional regulator [Gammaproteobacteria bacterium]|nr:TraR/DksA family transcriptional regulator [Gammaproteobacteria bacterium]